MHKQQPRRNTSASKVSTRGSNATLRVRLAIQKKRPSRTKCSWVGHEDVQEAVRRASLSIREATPAAEAACRQNGWDLGSFVLRGIHQPDSVRAYPEVAALADAHRFLRDLTARATQEHNLDFYLLRSVYAPILNPSEEEARLCADAVLTRATEQASIEVA